MASPSLTDLDKSHFWHPFTQMQDWCAPDHEPLIIKSGQGAILTDTKNNEYLDGNSSIWTNIHGHNHPAINEALKKQLARLSHTSALGLTNPTAIKLAAKLASFFADTTPALNKVFFSDNGSTAIECAVRMALQFHQQTDQPHRNQFITFTNAYHGDTLGAASLGAIATFRNPIENLGLTVSSVKNMDQLRDLPDETLQNTAALAIEPLIQGAAGMQTWPPGMLAHLRQWCDHHDILLILDEVMTGFGRTGKMFACQHEYVVPDFLCLAKGLTGGYLPLAATLTSQKIFDAFLGDSQKTFFYGHSYCGNPLAAAAALANIQIFEDEKTLTQLQPKITLLTQLLDHLKDNNPHVAAVRQCGFIAGIDIAHDHPQTGAQICLEARNHGLLTRPVLNTLVLMPPLCTTDDQLQSALLALNNATHSCLS
ncbi:MAG: adenosylmethionine--8-amino-7-oxononanoate transaminase [Verrucomicrobiota bacterium]